MHYFLCMSTLLLTTKFGRKKVGKALKLTQGLIKTHHFFEIVITSIITSSHNFNIRVS